MTKKELIYQAPLLLELYWQDKFLHHITLSWCLSLSTSNNYESDIADQLLTSLRRYLSGYSVVWPSLPIAWYRLSKFSKTVMQTLFTQVKYGEWISYSKLAQICGSPRAARAVGQIMKNNPWPLIIPCHRVLSKDKSLAGFSAGLEMKRYLLSIEGIYK